MLQYGACRNTERGESCCHKKMPQNVMERLSRQIYKNKLLPTLYALCYKSLNFFHNQLILSLTKLIKKYSNILNTNQTYYQNILNVSCKKN